MFKFHKTLDVLTLFHSSRSEASKRVLASLNEANVAAEESSSLSSNNNNDSKKQIFELEVTEGPMTTSQLRSILDYVGEDKAKDIVSGAHGVGDAMKILEGAGSGGDVIKRPITVDWNNGKVVIGDSKSAIKAMIDALPKQK